VEYIYFHPGEDEYEEHFKLLVPHFEKFEHLHSLDISAINLEDMDTCLGSILENMNELRELKTNGGDGFGTRCIEALTSAFKGGANSRIRRQKRLCDTVEVLELKDCLPFEGYFTAVVTQCPQLTRLISPTVGSEFLNTPDWVCTNLKTLSIRPAVGTASGWRAVSTRLSMLMHLHTLRITDDDHEWANHWKDPLRLWSFEPLKNLKQLEHLVLECNCPRTMLANGELDAFLDSWPMLGYLYLAKGAGREDGERLELPKSTCDIIEQRRIRYDTYRRSYCDVAAGLLN
jgi:hypothetical protein